MGLLDVLSRRFIVSTRISGGTSLSFTDVLLGKHVGVRGRK